MITFGTLRGNITQLTDFSLFTELLSFLLFDINDAAALVGSAACAGMVRKNGLPALGAGRQVCPHDPLVGSSFIAF